MSQSLSKNLVIEALDIVEANLRERISVKDVTQHFEKSHWHFQRLFRSLIGLSLGNYIRNRRLTEAAHDLRNTQLRVIDIAMTYDFGSQEAFARSFKQFSSMTPIEYRENTNYVIREAQHRIDATKVDYFWSDVQRTPQIESRSSKILYGSRVDFKSHFEEGSDCAVKVVDHWRGFLKKKNSISGSTENKILYGVALSTELELREKSLSYLAAIETDKLDQEIEGLEYLTLRSGLYAGFENRGLAQKRSSLMDYVYGIWLPSSSYVRGSGFDFETFDERYSLDNPHSISMLYIPISEGVRRSL